MSTPIIIGGNPPPQKRISTWVGGAVAVVGGAVLASPEVEQAVTAIAQQAFGKSALGASLAILGTQQAFLAARRWLQERGAKRR